MPNCEIGCGNFVFEHLWSHCVFAACCAGVDIFIVVVFIVIVLFACFVSAFSCSIGHLHRLLVIEVAFGKPT
jgi:hypothetical protein